MFVVDVMFQFHVQHVNVENTVSDVHLSLSWSSGLLFVLSPQQLSSSSIIYYHSSAKLVVRNPLHINYTM